MSDEKMIAISKKLLERSRQGDIAWSDTVDENTFSAAFPDYSVSIRRTPYYGQGEFKGKGIMYVLSVHNQLGTEVESLEVVKLDPDTEFEVPFTSENFEMLEQLFETAKRKALKSEDLLDDLLERLSKEDVPA